MSRFEKLYKFIFFALLTLVSLWMEFGCSSSSPSEHEIVIGPAVTGLAVAAAVPLLWTLEWEYRDRSAMNRALAGTACYTLVFSILFAIGIVLWNSRLDYRRALVGGGTWTCRQLLQNID